MRTPIRIVAAAAALAVLAGCATVQVDDALADANRATASFTGGKLELSRTADRNQARARLADELLSAPLTMDGAVQLALANSPSMQALVAQSAVELAAADRAGRLANPVFQFERVRSPGELEIGRLLSIGLLDLLTLPQRRGLARNEAQQATVRLGADVVDAVTQVRQSWVRAVAAQQLLGYSTQVERSAQASAELARRLQQVGNFNKLERARQQAFYADAAAQHANASHAATAAREELVRNLGLTSEQAARLRLPERLPDLPARPREAAEVRSAALDQRLDVRLARLQLDVAGKRQGLDLLSTLIDTEVGARRDTVFGAAGERQTRRGWEIDIRLPLFDQGGTARAGMDAEVLLAARRHDAVVRGASSQLRESYSAYRTAWDLARHYRDEIVPLRKTIADENLLRYNGMLLGVFELLADAREQVSAVTGAINAQQQFWLADAALSASLVGKPMAASAAANATKDPS